MSTEQLVTLFISAWGWALLNFIWQGLVIGAVAALLLALLRGAPARWRYVVCAFSLALCLLLPLVQCLDVAPSDTDLIGELSPLAEQMPALVGAWALGAGLMFGRLALGLAWVARARRRSTAAPAEWQARLDALARRLGLTRPVRLRLLPELAGPIALGTLKPCVLLPAALLTRLPVDLLEALLAHELAHVRRWDTSPTCCRAPLRPCCSSTPSSGGSRPACARSASWSPTTSRPRPWATRVAWRWPCTPCPNWITRP